MTRGAQLRALLARHAIRIDHIAIAIPNLQAAVQYYTQQLGFELLTARETRGEHTGMSSAVLRLADVTVVLLEGAEPESQVSRFVHEIGPGVQHIAVEVKALAPVAEALRELGVEFETDVIESEFTSQIFTVRTDQIGVRFEFIERHKPGFSDRAVETLFRTLEKRGVF